MELLIEYWFVVVALLCIIGGAIYLCVEFLQLPTKKQLDKVEEWLLFAVTEAEAELGSGTGQLKLRMVYDMFLQRFGTMARLISFERFSVLVDTALEEMRVMLKNNEDVRNLVGVTKNE